MKSLTDFRNKHVGTVAYVMGSGPSLRKADVGRMHATGITITSNSAVMHDTTPDYHVVMDGAAPYLKSFELVAASDAIVAMHNQIDHRGLISDDRVLMFALKRSGPLTRHAEYLTQWTTVPVTSVHLAIVLGCTRVVLLGCDCRREDGRRYFYEFWDPPVDDPMVEDFLATGFVRPQRRIIGSHVAPQKDDPVHEGGLFGSAQRDWKSAAPLLPNDVEVLDASGGNIGCFRQAKLDDILAVKADR